MRLVELWTPKKFHRTWDPDPLHILYRQRRKWRILWNFENLTSFGTEGVANYYAYRLFSRKLVHKLSRKRPSNIHPESFDFLLNVAFLWGPYLETVHHVGGFMQVSHKWCCGVGILKKMVRVAFQIVELLRFKYG